ncbi:MAG: ATP-binding cassette domain-containing protein [Alphaproteobacteria bacterium]|nr:ATP-binding cassette domain-containing protein [Alphaproteobacteria bacterium]
MKAAPLVVLRGAKLTFGGRPVFDGIDLSLHPGDRACLVGRNGTGKSTLMKVVAGWIDLDDGERFVQPGIRVAYLPQSPVFKAEETVRAHVAAGLPPAEDGRPQEFMVDDMLDHLSIDGTRLTTTLSGGEGRRTALARALVSKPDVLLLDEPTNHLDLPTIEWLEEELTRYRGALLLISHDRRFLADLTNRTYWLDRGVMRRRSEGFDGFEEWADKVLEDEENQARKLDKRIAEETRWLREGLTARRKRNMGRLNSLLGMRKERRDRVKVTGKATVVVDTEGGGGSLVFEANHLFKTVETPAGAKVLADDVSVRVKRGDRIGIIGPNGAGKSTLIKMLLGSVKPDKGRVRQGFGIDVAYFDQHRESLPREGTPWSVLCPDGGDTVFVGGSKPKHVASYLRDYLFEDRQFRSPVSSLSGGETNRLLLAKLFASPHNLLVLDEPTNDLDMETLDLLQEAVADYEGTVMLVSHDRDFLDRTVTGILAFEGDGKVTEYAGGYSDYVLQARKSLPAAEQVKAEAPKPKAAKPAGDPSRNRQARLSYKDQREYDQLPERIAGLEVEIERLEGALADPAFFEKTPDKFQAAAAALEKAKADLDTAETRWLELEEELAAIAEAKRA